MAKSNDTVLGALKDIMGRLETLEETVNDIAVTIGADAAALLEEAPEHSAPAKKQKPIVKKAPKKISKHSRRLLGVIEGVGSDLDGNYLIEDIKKVADSARMELQHVMDALDELHHLKIITDPGQNSIRLLI
jgi:hypothetical protein